MVHGILQLIQFFYSFRCIILYILYYVILYIQLYFFFGRTEVTLALPIQPEEQSNLFGISSIAI